MSKKFLLLLISIIFFLMPFKALAQKCEELDCNSIYRECIEETKRSFNYRQCVEAHKGFLRWECKKDDIDYDKCIENAEITAIEVCTKELEERLKICSGILETCNQMKKENCKKITADKFPETLNVNISRTCYWERNGSNIPVKTTDNYTIEGVVKLKKRSGDIIRYESKNLNVSYKYKEIGIMQHRSDPCYGKIVHKVTGEGNASAKLILDIYIGEAAKFVKNIRKGEIPTPARPKQFSFKGVYDFSGIIEGGTLLIEGADEDTGCTLTPQGRVPLPEGFTIVDQPLFSTQMIGMLKSSEVSNCEGEGYFKWSFSQGLVPLVQIFKKYGISVRLINYTQD